MHSQREALASRSWELRLEDAALIAKIIPGSFLAVGHSYGALVALTIAGASPTFPAAIQQPALEPRVQAVIGFSPPANMPGLVEDGAYASVNKPMFIQTGTRDMSPSAKQADAWRIHLKPYEEAPAYGQNFALILDMVDHYFGGAICDFSRAGPLQSRSLNAAIAQSLLFADAYARRDRAALASLKSRSGIRAPDMLLNR